MSFSVSAFLAAALYALNAPLSKLLLASVPPAMMAAFLYLGAGVGMTLWALCRCLIKHQPLRLHFTRGDSPYVAGMILLDIAAPILLMAGLNRTSSASASLLNNFEIVATALIAMLLFHEKMGKRLWAAIGLITLSGVLLSFEGGSSLRFSMGSLLVLLASCCWGLENNCTRMLSNKSSVQITTIKGLCCGVGSTVLALVTGETFPALPYVLLTLLLGFVAYGLSINFYIQAQKDLGAAKTSAYYSIAPFLGVIFGVVLLGERPAPQFYLGLAIMIAATVLMIRDSIALQHTHEHTHTHTHEHRHGDLVHTHEHTHVHSHTHIHGDDGSTHSHEHHHLEEHNHSHAQD